MAVNVSQGVIDNQDFRLETTEKKRTAENENNNKNNNQDNALED